MFDIAVDTPTGRIVFNYVISTPSKTAVATLEDTEKALPTVVFLHPVYIGKLIYHPQFADRELRRFNLVAVDLRFHGKTVGRAGEGYGREVAARDVGLFMQSLSISRYHIFGMSMGGCVGLQTAILFPEAVQSVFVVSSLPLTEPPDVAEGRQEIYDCWAEGSRHICSGSDDGLDVEGSAIRDAFQGALQLSLNGEPTKVFTAMLQRSAQLLRIDEPWPEERLDDLRITSVDFFVKREAYTVAALKNIRCPVHLIHCAADIAYALDTTEEVASRLTAAGVQVEVQQVSGAPHFGSVTHAKEINNVFHRFVASCIPTPLPPIPDSAESPFTGELAAMSVDSDSDSDREFFI
ncbi:AB hydrolase-1 domain-containing protein [Mycena indigotica]|uniref:AB hydrolase-1 domain-containing protein n=1 Tax=Mycena indigotica TaxID=2126181 RepID=A0A8H6VXU5_9AGAR|nr:AB hydrolase-1 domain-containing protein [Mycena indigotica]KAF7292149.1 AB hydrolase-1 domain-containing protein [Mycena indigotica]